ncbi:hypothetical protein FPQ18DRAFT_304917 [Pyronema domesticum]|nr:hypothetical protein FPQ18DRAFT_304917 [Pyronema domesticum]
MSIHEFNEKNIATLYWKSITSFQDLFDFFKEPDHENAPSSLADDFGRLQVWAENVAAHRRGVMSLDHRIHLNTFLVGTSGISSGNSEESQSDHNNELESSHEANPMRDAEHALPVDVDTAAEIASTTSLKEAIKTPRLATD